MGIQLSKTVYQVLKSPAFTKVGLFLCLTDKKSGWPSDQALVCKTKEAGLNPAPDSGKSSSESASSNSEGEKIRVEVNGL